MEKVISPPNFSWCQNVFLANDLIDDDLSEVIGQEIAFSN